MANGNQTLAAFGDAARSVAEQEGVAFADLHTVMVGAMARFKQLHPDKSFVGSDGIHPENVGHMVMAYAFLKALGCSGDIGTITIDMADHSAQATAGQDVVSTQGDTTIVQSSRWPFPIVKNDDALSLYAGTQLVPFMADLDRFTLVVKNAPAGKRLKVTWSEIDPAQPGPNEKPVEPTVVSGEFSAEALSAGINLAAAFPTTPFEHAFNRLDEAVHAQQEFETPLVKQCLHNQESWSKVAPDAAAAFTDVAMEGSRLDGQLRRLASAMVVPVKHSIRVEVEQQ
jgi:hypothetical protein